MIRNYIKTAWRNLLHNKSYTIINITGLAIGIAACLLIFLIIKFETSFDNFHSKKDSIYRIVSKIPQQNLIIGGVPYPTADAIRLDFPQLKEVAALYCSGTSNFTIPTDKTGADKKFNEPVFYTEPQFFTMFDFAWLAGDKKTALTEPNTVVLTQQEAEKFFGSWKDAIGKTVKTQYNTNLKVTGILKNMPTNTDFPIDMFISCATIKLSGGDYNTHAQDWVTINGSNNCFLVLPSNISVAKFNSDLTAFVKRHKSADYVSQGMLLQPLTDIHYNTSINWFTQIIFSKELINIISLIGLFLLIIACVNFINLATAQAVNRSKEVGIRKVMGSNRMQLMLQFISETFIITLVAIILAIGIAYITVPFLNTLLNIQLSSSFLSNAVVLLFLAGLLFGVTFLAGFYPALVLSGFNPISALKNRVAAGSTNGVSLRRGLVILQFCIAQILVIGTIVIISQMDYFKNKSLGFAKDAVMNVPIPTDSLSQTRLNALRDQLLQQPGVKDVSYSFASPSDNVGWNIDFKYDNSPKKSDFDASAIWTDAEYFKLYKMEFIAGRPYAKTDTVHEYVVNETMLKKLGVRNPKDAIGKYLNLWDDKTKYAPIVGVVKDFNVSSLKEQIPAVIMGSWKSTYQVINIKIQPANIKQTLASVEKLWTANFPANIYQYQFLDDKIAGFYQSEDQLSQLYKIFAGIAIFISCLGLYGLISFMAVQRTKEVGIRKTLGASVSSIVYLFSKEFTLLIIIAFAISAPLGWYFMNNWLQGFTFRISLSPGIFILAITASVIIAWLTVGYKAIGAALANPVKSLRSE